MAFYIPLTLDWIPVVQESTRGKISETSFQTRYYHDYILHYNYHINKLHFQMST